MKDNPTKEKILETAIDLFSRSSFSAVSIRHITKAVGIKESSLYYHYKNKDELLDSIFEMYRAEIRKVTPPIEQLDRILAVTEPEAFLLHGLRKFKAMICDSPGMSRISRIVSTEQFAHPKARSIILDDLYENNVLFLEAVFSKYIELGRIRPFPARLLAVQYQYPVFSLISQYQIMQFDGRDTSGVERQLEEHVAFFIQTIKTIEKKVER
ncbi:TetR/AcrR family transcriptional regulator [Paenibacillus thermotolerans]|uniref:TetR/AcrR family transcriptional regulator n=1 Tax=Paenibacillus thermotolerans TaxID=3027807 RepID=UPI0023688C82|nr:MULTISPECIES: TetR/AcrR family transcriptional regulator [unclassified Paenibacillus]